jgi:lysophospholipase L1-like esterase
LNKAFSLSALVWLAAGCAAALDIDPQAHCRVPDGLVASAGALPRTTTRLGAHDPLVVVAIGSSSTAGAGASGPTATYPARLQDELRRRFPESPIAVVNKGINGETMAQMMARFDEDVIALKPDLVIWQTGTNSVLRDHDPDQFRRQLAVGVRTLRAAGLDVILMAPQYAPRFNRRPKRMAFVDAINQVAAEEGVTLFPRHAIMKYWSDSGRFDFKTMLSPDGLHLNDLSYDCIAQLLAERIETTVTPSLLARSAR